MVASSKAIHLTELLTCDTIRYLMPMTMKNIIKTTHSPGQHACIFSIGIGRSFCLCSKI
jgi:hypothetical protein